MPTSYAHSYSRSKNAGGLQRLQSTDAVAALCAEYDWECAEAGEICFPSSGGAGEVEVLPEGVFRLCRGSPNVLGSKWFTWEVDPKARVFTGNHSLCH